MENNTNKLLTLEEVAEECRAPVASVRRWIADGRLKSIRPGRMRLVFRTELDRFLTTDIKPQVRSTAMFGTEIHEELDELTGQTVGAEREVWK